MEYDNTNKGVLFQNERKQSEKSPDYTGTINVNGKELRIAGWKRLSKNNKPFLSLSISEQQPKQSQNTQTTQQQIPQTQAPQEEVVNVDEIPF